MTRPEGNSSFCFPRISMFPRGNIEIRGKQNELFPEGPVIKWFVILQNKWVKHFEKKRSDSSDNIRPPATARSDHVQQRSTFRG